MITKASLTDLNNPKIFKHGLLASVHPSCSPWTTEELQKAYPSTVYQKVIGSEIPISKSQAHPKCTSCSVCAQDFKETEMVMLIPTTHQELISQNLKQLGEVTCQCPELINGHLIDCYFKN